MKGKHPDRRKKRVYVRAHYRNFW